ncbi:refilin-B [Protopterus annectens]|uniref:refilin-B n=1 Tax=Protopterus annectens TaxID=7888 RepID=UPI001CFBAEF8|nr:refilin-B [Protopterus annectens]
MVGRLNLPDVSEPPGMKKNGERLLDSPDSGLPPSPSPSSWLLSPVSTERGLGSGLPVADGNEQPPTPQISASVALPGCVPKLYPLSFGEGVEFEPMPPKELRYTSSVKYDSDRHFIDNIFLPVGLGFASYSQTIICVPDCTWRNYKTELTFVPRNKPLHFLSTVIVYPKHAKTVYTTTLDYNCRKTTQRFLSSVELEAAESNASDCLLDEY